MRRQNITKSFFLLLVIIIGLMTIVASGGGDGGGSENNSDVSSDSSTIDPYEILPSSISTFNYVEDGEICIEDDKPVIRMYSSPTCPYCTWAARAFDPVVKSYVDDGLIAAHHWEVWNIYTGTGDDLLTDEVEGIIPDSELEILDTFNPEYSAPFFVFGCKYTRLGATRYSDGLQEEAAEFMAVIEELLDSVQ